MSAQERINTIEYELFSELISYVKRYTDIFSTAAQQIAQLDCLASFAKVSFENNYAEPQIHEGYDLKLVESRHPVIEKLQEFIPNNISIEPQNRMMIITGPNMAGKSTFMRQIALCYILAQCGCFIPAKEATMGIVDSIFTRVGSRDDLSKGQSTFMVEMVEVATILHNATEKSFVILDEIGSGTSTYDGVAIAWAVANDILERVKCKALFSTHYHVLTRIAESEGATNYHIAVHEEDGNITFLRKIVDGATDKSYGIHVAALAGVPKHVIEHAQKIQLQLEDDDTLHKRIVVENVTPESTAISEKEVRKLTQKTLLD